MTRCDLRGPTCGCALRFPGVSLRFVAFRYGGVVRCGADVFECKCECECECGLASHRTSLCRGSACYAELKVLGRGAPARLHRAGAQDQAFSNGKGWMARVAWGHGGREHRWAP